MPKLSEIRIRDAYILVDNDTYYLYGTVNEQNEERNLYVFESKDLENFSEPKIIFTLPEDGWGKRDLWAPEVHKYHGKFYMFYSVQGQDGFHRGTMIAVCDRPNGIFENISKYPATPINKSCIDGTLYVEDGLPYIIFSHDWPDNFEREREIYNGQILAQELTEDLQEPVGEAFLLFDSMEAPVSAVAPHTHKSWGKMISRYGSDGPFIHKNENGALVLIWSPIPAANYMVASAVQKDGKIKGEWKHHTTPVYDKNSGHAMIFKDLSGQLKLCMHGPEEPMKERTVLLNIKETEDNIELL